MLEQQEEEQSKSSLPPEAPQDSPYEEYLFGDERPNINEPNTEAEKKIIRALRSHYSGGSHDSSLGVGQRYDLLSVKNKGWYKHILEVPSKYTKAYRLMDDIDEEKLDDMFSVGDKYHRKGSHSEPLPYGGREDLRVGSGHVEVVTGGTYIPKGSGSWTVDKQAVLAIAEDYWFRISTSYPENPMAIAVVDLGVARDRFLLNPDAIAELGLPGKYAYQKEVLSVGSVPLEKTVIGWVGIEEWEWDRDTVGEYEDTYYDEDDDIPEVVEEYDSVVNYDYYHEDEYQTHRRLVVKEMLRYL